MYKSVLYLDKAYEVQGEDIAKANLVISLILVIGVVVLFIKMMFVFLMLIVSMIYIIFV